MSYIDNHFVKEQRASKKGRSIKTGLFEDFNITCNSIDVHSENDNCMVFVIDEKRAVFPIETINLLFKTWLLKAANNMPSESDFNNFCVYMFLFIK